MQLNNILNGRCFPSEDASTEVDSSLTITFDQDMNTRNLEVINQRKLRSGAWDEETV